MQYVTPTGDPSNFEIEFGVQFYARNYFSGAFMLLPIYQNTVYGLLAV
jgi:hypothetical protein